MTDKLTGELLVERMTLEEKKRARLVENVLPALRERAVAADADAQFQVSHIKTLSDAGLLGLIVPTEFGGLGGGLRDLVAATFAMGTACPSTALAYFFHCSSASRGLLALEALEAGLFDTDESTQVRTFAEKVLTKMGRDGKWLANFASEAVKSVSGADTITTEAKAVKGGWSLSGTKSFGSATGVADEYLVMAMLSGSHTADGLGLFLVPRNTAGVSPRAPWVPIGMRATATDGIVLDNAFVPAADALAIPGAFARLMQMSRGSFVDNQIAVAAIYQAIAQTVYDHVVEGLAHNRFQDTGRPIAESPFHQEVIGDMTVDLETGYLWLRRQLELETSEPPLLPKSAVVRQWRMAKGEVCEAAFRVATKAFKASGTTSTTDSDVVARALRDLSMGLVQSFPAERGRLETARMVIAAREQELSSLGGGLQL
jgi:alkylation response protein AidB-like acyl-CoA dehydrogenase